MVPPLAEGCVVGCSLEPKSVGLVNDCLNVQSDDVGLFVFTLLHLLSQFGETFFKILDLFLANLAAKIEELANGFS